ALALTVASTADRKRFPEALRLVGLDLDARGEPVDGPAPQGGWSAGDQVVRARVLAAQPRRTVRAPAGGLLGEIHKRQALAADDQLLLAQLYQALGDDPAWWAKARELMQTLTGSTHPRHPAYLSAFAQALLQHGDYVEAERIINRLEQEEKRRQAPLGAA